MLKRSSLVSQQLISLVLLHRSRCALLLLHQLLLERTKRLLHQQLGRKLLVLVLLCRQLSGLLLLLLLQLGLSLLLLQL